MKTVAKGLLEAGTPTPQEVAPTFQVEWDGLPVGVPLFVVVEYEDVRQPVSYALGTIPENGDDESPETGHVTFAFPVVGKGGSYRVFAGEGDDEELVVPRTRIE